MSMKLIDFTELMQTEYPEPKWAVPKLIPEGLTLLVGRPKMGKSWLALSLALEVASGGRALGSIPVKKGKAVYFALEDNERRLQARCASLMDDRSIEEGQLMFSTAIDKFYKKEDKKPEENGLAQLENLIDEMGEELRVIFIDTLALITPKGKSENSYSDNYDYISDIQKLAIKKGIAIVLVHHTRKGQSEVYALDDVMGSTGLTAGADCILMLKRTPDGNELFVTGRDVEEQQLAIKHNNKTGLWKLIGNTKFTRMSKAHADIYDILIQRGPLTNKEICDITKKASNNVSGLLARMAGDSIITKEGRLYKAVMDELSELSESSELSELSEFSDTHFDSLLESEQNSTRKGSHRKDSKINSLDSLDSPQSSKMTKHNGNSPNSFNSPNSLNGIDPFDIVE
jgi:KaiC/GvpD/RAD55 family RecA-like ATPase